MNEDDINIRKAIKFGSVGLVGLMALGIYITNRFGCNCQENREYMEEAIKATHIRKLTISHLYLWKSLKH